MNNNKIEINIPTQTLKLIADEKIFRYDISSAKNGHGQLNGSGCTPLGKHFVRAKIGTDLAPNSVLVARRPTGEIYSKELAKKFPNRDWVLTRILWLCGCEIGFNRLGDVDSMCRYIYIHATPDSEPMGIPLSHGCIRMRNRDIIQLFDSIQVGIPVTISN